MESSTQESEEYVCYKWLTSTLLCGLGIYFKYETEETARKRYSHRERPRVCRAHEVLWGPVLNSQHLAECNHSEPQDAANTRSLFAAVTPPPWQPARELSPTSQNPSIFGTHDCHKRQGWDMPMQSQSTSLSLMLTQHCAVIRASPLAVKTTVGSVQARRVNGAIKRHYPISQSNRFYKAI